MSAAVISGAVVLILIAIIIIAARAYLTDDTGRHGENMNAIDPKCLYCGKPMSDDEGHMHGGGNNPGDDTEQFSWMDRKAYIETQERLATTDEHILFLASEEWWAEEIKLIFADSARIDADLNSGRLAFPEWIWSTQKI